MPVQIIEKRKTEPQCPNQHESLVPLRVTAVIEHQIPHAFRDSLLKYVEINDILLKLPSLIHADSLFNATKGISIGTQFNEGIRCVRAYNIQQIVICNDNQPAPVI